MKNEAGFTLIELLVVITIVLVLSAMASSQYSFYKKESYNSATNSDFRNAMLGLEAYEQDNDAYPTCGTTSCVGTLPGFVQSSGVQVSFSGVAHDSITGVACHEKGDMRFVFTGIPGLIVNLRTGPCGA